MRSRASSRACACLAAGAMAAGGIARLLKAIGPHRLPYRGEHGSGGVVVEIDDVHGDQKLTAGDGPASVGWTPAGCFALFYFKVGRNVKVGRICFPGPPSNKLPQR